MVRVKVTTDRSDPEWVRFRVVGVRGWGLRVKVLRVRGAKG